MKSVTPSSKFIIKIKNSCWNYFKLADGQKLRKLKNFSLLKTIFQVFFLVAATN